MGQIVLRGILVAQGLLTVIGVLYASQMVRSSVRARVRFTSWTLLWSHVGMFCFDALLIREMLEEIRWDNSGVSLLEIVFGIFTCWLVLDVALWDHELLTEPA